MSFSFIYYLSVSVDLSSYSFMKYILVNEIHVFRPNLIIFKGAGHFSQSCLETLSRC